MKRNSYTVLYAVILGGVCSLVPTAVSEYTAPYREANIQAEEMRNILRVLEVPVPHKATSQELVDQFNRSVRTRMQGKQKLFVTCDSQDTTQIEAAAVGFSGPGIWGLIKGFLALEKDMTTIRRISFYHNEETPGLGGEIGTEWFESKFVGKKIVDASGARGFKIRRTGAQGPNEIDGISGATLTCNKVQAILNNLIHELGREHGNE